MVNASRKMRFSLFGLPAGWKERPRKSPDQSRRLATGLGARVARQQSPILRASKEILEFCSAKCKSKRGKYNQLAGPNDNPAGSLKCAKRRVLFCPQDRNAEHRPPTFGRVQKYMLSHEQNAIAPSETFPRRGDTSS